MLRRIDSSERLSKFLTEFSTSAARYRGLPMIIGTVILVLSFLCFGLVILSLVLSDAADGAWLWLCLPVALIHISMLVFYIGVMLAVPLGEGFRSSD